MNILMKLDNLFVTAQITREVGSAEYDQLIMIYRSGEKIHGLVDQFPWMPFIVESVIEEDRATTFNLRMMGR